MPHAMQVWLTTSHLPAFGELLMLVRRWGFDPVFECLGLVVPLLELQGVMKQLEQHKQQGYVCTE